MIELSMGVVILVVSISAAISSQLLAHNLLRTSRETNLAMADLRGAMELALLLSPAALPIAGSEFESGTSIARFDDLHLANEAITATYPGYVAGNPVPDPLQVVLTIRWNDWQARARSMSLATLRTR
ncbi:MAG TPA: hypothetical protein VM509_14210 [Planctomycetota bacterium]|nr:hypothetical protein [Planctomycetota bacterium]